MQGCISVAAALACLGLATAQSIPPGEVHSRTGPYVPPAAITLRTDVRMVEVPVVVRDTQRRAVAGLTKDDFEIFDDGKRQAITAFSVQSPRMQGTSTAAENRSRPRFIALCFDNLHLFPDSLKPIKEAALRFVRTKLAPGDRVVVVTTARLEDAEFTGDVPALVEQISKVAATYRGVSADSAGCPRIATQEAYQLVNHQDPGDMVLHEKMGECEACYHNPCRPEQVIGIARAVWEHARRNTIGTLGVIDFLVDSMAPLPGQRMILLTSAGFLMGTVEADAERLMSKARHSEVVINTLGARGPLNDELRVIASGTGGAFFHNDNDLDRGFQELGMAPETIYMLGFTPSGAADGRFHKLKVRVEAGKGYSIQARLGYNAPPANAAAPSSPLSKLDREAMASDTIAELPVSFTWEQWAGPPGITMIAHLDISRLHFTTRQRRRSQKLTIVAVLLDSHGSFVTGKRSELELDFTDATFEQFAKTGFPAAMTLEAPPGSYSVRALAQDAMDGKLAGASAVVQIK